MSRSERAEAPQRERRGVFMQKKKHLAGIFHGRKPEGERKCKVWVMKVNDPRWLEDAGKALSNLAEVTGSGHGPNRVKFVQSAPTHMLRSAAAARVRLTHYGMTGETLDSLRQFPFPQA